MAKTEHPYKHFFDSDKLWSTLIIGTFPPDIELRKDKKCIAEYYYGNKGSLWKIIGAIYKDYRFEAADLEANRKQMIEWQEDYSVGIADTLNFVDRTNQQSTKDSDLIFDYFDLNHELKKYILTNIDSIEKILFTSTGNCNSALSTFKYLFGNDIIRVKDKLVIDLPSPSGSSNVSLLNVNNENTLGLHEDFYNYIYHERNEELRELIKRYEIKKIKKKQSSHEVKIPSIKKGLVKDYKIWKYEQALPKPKIQ